MEKFDLKDLENFSLNSKFKTAKTNSYLYFTIDEEKEIRIYRTNLTSKDSIKYRVTLHTIDDDGITYKPYEKNEPALNLKEAKLIAGKYYFNTVRA